VQVFSFAVIGLPGLPRTTRIARKSEAVTFSRLPRFSRSFAGRNRNGSIQQDIDSGEFQTAVIDPLDRPDLR
jgi:hypothetical protein